MGLEDRDWFQEGRAERMRRIEAATRQQPRPPTPPPPPPPPGTTAYPPAGHGRRFSFHPISLLWIVGLFALAYLVGGHVEGRHGGWTSPVDPFGVMRAEPFPANDTVHWLSTRRSGTMLANFTVVAPHTGPRYYFVELIAEDTHQPVVQFYLWRGMSVSIRLQLGEYQLHYAEGSHWYGSGRMFGDNGRIFEADHPLSLFATGYVVTGRVVYLHHVLGGNLPVHHTGRF